MDYIVEPLRSLAVPVDSLVPDPTNARIHTPRNRDAVRKSLEVFGQIRPIVVRGNMIVAGNCTWEQTKDLGRTHIAVIDADHLTPEQAVAFAIADNKTAELAEWDYQGLGEHLRALDDDLRSYTGFADFEIEPLLQAEWKPPESTGIDDYALRPSHGHGLHLPDEVLDLLRQTMNATMKTDTGAAIKEICEHYLSCHRVNEVTNG